jgi:hypothetical protein
MKKRAERVIRKPMKKSARPRSGDERSKAAVGRPLAPGFGDQRYGCVLLAGPCAWRRAMT